MQFIINGTTYEAASLERVTGLDALELPRQAGLGIQQVARRLEEIARLAYAPDGSVVVVADPAPAGAPDPDPSAVMDSEPHLRALLAFLWLSRRLGGEHRLTFDEAASFPLASLEVVTDDVPGDVAADPTLPGSDPAAVPAGA